MSTMPLALEQFVDVAPHLLDLGGHELCERAPLSVMLLLKSLGHQSKAQRSHDAPCAS